MTGVRTAIQTYREEDFLPREEGTFDDFAARLSRYAVSDSYRDNDIYSSTNRMSGVLKLVSKLYKNIRPIYNPVGRLIELIVSYVYIGNIDSENLTGGSVPIVTKNKSLFTPIKRLFKDSDWNTNIGLMVSNAAMYGDAAIKIVDDPQRQKVYLENLHPGRIKDVQLDNRGNVKQIIIQYRRDEPVDLTIVKSGIIEQVQSLFTKKTYEYTEIITKEKFSTFKDGKPFAFYADASGRLVSEWDNDYGFVPVVLAPFKKTGLKWNTNAFYKVMPKINEINNLASLLNDQIKKIVIPLLAALGVKASDLEVNADNPDGLNILFLPTIDSDLKPITTPLDITSTNATILAMQEELIADLPVLAFQQIRSGGGDLTEPGINAAYSDGVALIRAVRTHMDGALVRAIKMGISIGGFNAYPDYEGFSLDSYENGDLEFSIKDRPVISISLSVEQKVTLISQISGLTPPLQRIALKEMGYDEATIDEVVLAAEEATRNAVRGLADSLFSDPTGANGGGSKPPKQVGAGQSQKMLPAMVGAN